MTDIDALIAEATDFFNGRDWGGVHLVHKYGNELINAITTERAKVAALEAEVQFWQERHDALEDRCKIDDAALQDLLCRADVAAGYPADDEDQSNDAHIGRLFIQHRYAFAKAVADQAEAARWRDVAGELAGIAERQHEELRMIRIKDCNAVYDTFIRTETQIALARFKQESGQ